MVKLLQKLHGGVLSIPYRHPLHKTLMHIHLSSELWISYIYITLVVFTNSITSVEHQAALFYFPCAAVAESLQCSRRCPLVHKNKLKWRTAQRPSSFLAHGATPQHSTPSLVCGKASCWSVGLWLLAHVLFSLVVSMPCSILLC